MIDAIIVYPDTIAEVTIQKQHRPTSGIMLDDADMNL